MELLREALRLDKTILHGRKRRVTLEEAKSSWTDVLSGVPQGPILFLLYINELR